ncbi:unnamed protein product [Paramecium sonneborni]|uniref:Tubulin-tyrosine ligase family protein n=1 Tax=Paramecium sonneborni TaxID=65129 RepID=A0A8S1N7Q9_9CILI|nr:unnamed protein product [Paramecium sonneborni]
MESINQYIYNVTIQMKLYLLQLYLQYQAYYTLQNNYIYQLDCIQNIKFTKQLVQILNQRMFVVYVFNYYHKKLFNYYANINFIKYVLKNGLEQKALVQFVKGNMKQYNLIIQTISDLFIIIIKKMQQKQSKKSKEEEPIFNGQFKDNSDDENDDKRKKQTLIMNVSDTKYDVVKFVGKKIFKWILQYEPDGINWDMFWTDAAVQPETLGKMQPHQKINHFPGMYSLARKNHLGRNLMKMRKQFPNDFKFFPQTWLLPAEYGDFKNQFVKGKVRTFIVKPEASCQGRGIFLTRNINDINPTDHYVAQRYMHRPFLIDGLKFDLRVYVLLAGTDPLRIYVYQDGLVRFATESYVTPTTNNLEDVCMHLTNYAINKENPNFVFNNDATKMDVGHKRSIKSVFGKLQDEGHNIEKLWQDMYKLFIKTFCTVQPILSHHYKSCQPDNYANNMCFEILGFDIFINDKLRPFLLEVNHTPSFTTDTPLDSLIKKNLIRDTLKLMNVSIRAKEEIISSRREQLQQRVLTGKKQKLTQEEKNVLIQQCSQQRDQHENNNLGDYVKIYPLEDAQDYNKFIEFASQLQDNWTGANIRRNQKKEQSETPQSQANKPPTIPVKKPNTPQMFPKISERQNRIQESIEPQKNEELKSKTQSSLGKIKKETKRQISDPPLPKQHQSMRNVQQAIQQQQGIPQQLQQKSCLQPKLFELDILSSQNKSNSQNKKQNQFKQ